MSSNGLVGRTMPNIRAAWFLRFNPCLRSFGAGALILLAGMSVAHSDPAPTQITPFSTATVGTALPGAWIHRRLPQVERANHFELMALDGTVVLGVESEAAASTLVHPLDADPAHTPILAWRWMISNPVRRSDFTRKEGDDYAARVYVLFDYPVERLGLGERVRMSLARTLHGAELPTAAIAYVWGTAQAEGVSGPNPYTDRVQMIVVASGDAGVGEWHEVRRDVAADFMRVFGEPAPRINGIAVGADTDNTGERVSTRFGDLRLEVRE